MSTLHQTISKVALKCLDCHPFDMSELVELTNFLQKVKPEFSEVLASNKSILSQVCKRIYDLARLPNLKDGLKDHLEDDLANYKHNIKPVLHFFSVLTSLLLNRAVYTQSEVEKTAYLQNEDIFQKNVIVFGLLLAFENIDETKGWTSDIAVKLSHKLIHSVSKIKSSNISEVLITNKCTTNSSYFYHILQEIKISVKDYGVHCIGILSAFRFILEHVKHPNLSGYVNEVFPTCLVLSDDYDIDNKVNGVICLNHLIDNVSYSSLQMYGRSEVIYSTLHKMLYSNEAKLLQVVLPAILKTLKIEANMTAWMATFPVSKDCPKLHEVTQILLYNMEFENKLNIRRVYASNLSLYIRALGIQCVKHFQRLFRVIYGYMEVHDGMKETNRILAVKSLHLLITNTWPRIPRYSCEILKNIVKLVIDVTDNNAVIDSSALANILEVSSECFKVLYVLDAKSVMQTIDGVRELAIADKTNQFLSEQATNLSS